MASFAFGKPFLVAIFLAVLPWKSYACPVKSDFCFNACIYLFALFVQLPFSSLSCAASSWLPLPFVSFPSFSLLPTPNRPCQSKRSSKARHEADSFEPAEWSEQLTPGQSGWLGAAAVGSIPALALSLFLQRLYLCLRAVRSAAILLFVLRRFVLAASSACFFPFFLPPPNPQSTVSVRT